MALLNYDNLFETIEELVIHHSPSGAEGEINNLLISRFAALGVNVWKDSADNVIAKITGCKQEGAIGALYFTQRQRLDALIALEICPLAPEYPIADSIAPVLLSQDGYGVYDETLNVQLAAISGFGSDASIAMKFGHVGRAACLAFPTQNTHGYEIAHLGAIANCIDILCTYCHQEIEGSPSTG